MDAMRRIVQDQVTDDLSLMLGMSWLSFSHRASWGTGTTGNLNLSSHILDSLQSLCMEALLYWSFQGGSKGCKYKETSRKLSKNEQDQVYKDALKARDPGIDWDSRRLPLGIVCSPTGCSFTMIRKADGKQITFIWAPWIIAKTHSILAHWFICEYVQSIIHSVEWNTFRCFVHRFIFVLDSFCCKGSWKCNLVVKWVSKKAPQFPDALLNACPNFAYLCDFVTMYDILRHLVCLRIAYALILPTESTLMQEAKPPIDPTRLHEARNRVREVIATTAKRKSWNVFLIAFPKCWWKEQRDGSWIGDSWENLCDVWGDGASFFWARSGGTFRLWHFVVLYSSRLALFFLRLSGMQSMVLDGSCFLQTSKFWQKLLPSRFQGSLWLRA